MFISGTRPFVCEWLWPTTCILNKLRVNKSTQVRKKQKKMKSNRKKIRRDSKLGKSIIIIA